ncbi:MAG: CsgG/HfaB family protein [Pseudomonadota bacterium]
MRKHNLFLSFIFSLISLFFTPLVIAEKATIAVMSYADFVPDRTAAQAGELIGMPDVLAGRVIEKLATGQRFNVVERKALRRIVTGQRFGKNMQKNYLDKSLDKAIGEMEKMWGGEINAAASWSDHNDIVKDFQDLGSMVGADFLVLGNLEKNKRSIKSTNVPYSSSNKKHIKKMVDARLRLRVIDVKTGMIKGAVSIRSKLSESVFKGKQSDSDSFSVFDKLATLAAAKILDITFPAKIVSLDPLIISRGSNDGVKVGDVYTIQHEGKEIKDSNGIVLAKLKQKVGSVKIINTQKTIAIVEAINTGNFQQGDLAELEIAEAAANTPAEQEKISINQNNNSVPSGKIPRLAVGLIKMDSTANTSAKARIHSPIFTDNMISGLSKTKRFQLIDRQEVDQLLNEQLAQSMTNNQDLSSAMGSLKGADYLVYGNLASISNVKKVTKLPNSNRVYKQRFGEASGNMRIVDAHSGDIIASRKIKVTMVLPMVATERQVIDKLAQAYSEQVVMMLMDALYPIKAAHVSNNGLVYINRGSDGGLSIGEELSIFKTGQAIIDPDTGIKLGVEEEYVGKLVITEVENARSKGEQIEGSGISRGDLLKRSSKNKAQHAGASSNKPAQSKRSGGTLGKTSTAKRKKPTLAMGKFSINSSLRTTDTFTLGHLKRISDGVINNLSNSKRFVMMERQEIDQVLDEKTFESIAAGGDIRSRLGELAGADYLIHGELTNFYIRTERKKIPYVNEYQTSAKTYAEGIFRIVDVHKGSIISSEKIRISHKVKRIKDVTQATSDLIDQFINASVAKIILRLFPIKVMGTSADGTVYLNRGLDSGIKEGTMYQVMREGQALIDPDTGESFGRTESKVAIITISSVEARRALAQLKSGNDPQSGDILRIMKKIARKPVQKVMQPNW